MRESFTAEVIVTDSKQSYEPELARLASAWFESEVTCIDLNVVMNAETRRFLARGTFVRQPLPSSSRIESAARWLGLVRSPGQ